MIITQDGRGLRCVEVKARRINHVKRHVAGIRRKLFQFFRGEAAFPVKDGRRREVARGNEERFSYRCSGNCLRRLSNGGVELENGFRRFLLVPHCNCQHSSGLQSAYIGFHGLFGVIVFLNNRKPTGVGKSG